MLNDALYAYGCGVRRSLSAGGVGLEAAVQAASRGSDREKLAAVAAVYANTYDSEAREKLAAPAGMASWLGNQVAKLPQAASNLASAGASAAGKTKVKADEQSLAARAMDLLAGTDVGTKIKQTVSDTAGRAADFLGGAADATKNVAEATRRMGVQTEAQQFEAAKGHLPYWLKDQLDNANDLKANPLKNSELPAQITSRGILNRVNEFIRNRGLTKVPDYLQTKIDKHLPEWTPPVRPIYIKGPNGENYRVTRE